MIKAQHFLTLATLTLMAGCATQQPSKASFTTPPPPMPESPAPRAMVATPAAPRAMVTSLATTVFVSRKVTPPPAVTLAWDASTDPTVVGYNIYTGTATRAYTNMISLGNVTSCSVSNLAFSTLYFFAATAYSANGLESDYSGEANLATATQPLPPGNFRLNGNFALAPDGPWLPETNWPAILVQNPLGNQFWRVQAERIQ